MFLDLGPLAGMIRRHCYTVRLIPPEGFRRRIGLGSGRLNHVQTFVVLNQRGQHRKNYRHEYDSNRDKGPPVEPRRRGLRLKLESFWEVAAYESPTKP
jgi:hypothetical protein